MDSRPLCCSEFRLLSLRNKTLQEISESEWKCPLIIPMVTVCSVTEIKMKKLAIFKECASTLKLSRQKYVHRQEKLCQIVFEDCMESKKVLLNSFLLILISDLSISGMKPRTSEDMAPDIFENCEYLPLWSKVSILTEVIHSSCVSTKIYSDLQFSAIKLWFFNSLPPLVPLS